MKPLTGNLFKLGLRDDSVSVPKILTFDYCQLIVCFSVVNCHFTIVEKYFTKKNITY